MIGTARPWLESQPQTQSTKERTLQLSSCSLLVCKHCKVFPQSNVLLKSSGFMKGVQQNLKLKHHSRQLIHVFSHLENISKNSPPDFVFVKHYYSVNKSLKCPTRIPNLTSIPDILPTTKKSVILVVDCSSVCLCIRDQKM